MRIAIIYPPFYHVENQPNIKSVDNNYGVYPNISLTYVAAILEKEGHSVIFIDANALKLTKEEVLSQIQKFRPELLCFTVSTYIFHQILSWIRYLKEHTGLPTLVGGVHMSFYPRETFTYKEIDYAVIGEAENTLPKFIDAIERDKNLSDIDGIVYRQGSKTNVNDKVRPVMDLDSVPLPARHLLPNNKYFEFISQRKNFTGLVSSRGCPFGCKFCEQSTSMFRARSAKNIVDEFETCYNDFKIREIDIFDSTFTLQRKRVLSICNELIKRKLDIQWAVRSRIDLVDSGMLKALNKAGCKRIYYGIESGNPRILRNIGKDTDIGLIRKTISATKKNGISTFGYFMLGCPGDNIKTINQTINFAKSLDLDYAQFSKLSLLPGTEIYNQLVGERKEDYWSNFIVDEKVQKILSRPDVSLSEDEIQRLVRKAYRSFYFRPSYVAKAILRIKSADELKRSIKAALDMIIVKD